MSGYLWDPPRAEALRLVWEWEQASVGAAWATALVVWALASAPELALPLAPPEALESPRAWESRQVGSSLLESRRS